MPVEQADLERLMEAHRMRLRLHCYRMLGSSHDAEDMVQETLARAFRSRSSLENAAAVTGWLYRIATNVCIDELARRKPRMHGRETGPASPPDADPGVGSDEDWIEPAPSAWLSAGDPSAAYSQKESVALAFVAALQVLTPAQRAVLLLRDVVGLSAEETAEALESSVSAANSTLHRARVALDERVGPRERLSPSGPVDRELLERYLKAWDTGDFAVIVSLLHEEATIAMPPRPMWVAGKDAIVQFFTTRVKEAMEAGRYRTMLTSANGLPAVAFYRLRDDDGVRHLFALQVLEWADNRVKTIDHYMTPSTLGAFNLPASLP